MPQSFKATINKIDSLRSRIHHARTTETDRVRIHNRFEFDIMLKALELLRHTIALGSRPE